ncbi:preprotein translocase subunit YajC [Curtobacterium sp. MCJR17_055]|uniref:preprotein translocase subunit YajC n=1 Tax=unclassified Curtobacterium TaxID=257496 RepID=UPI000D8BE34A|nr:MULTISPECIES: preprotein translocase subunit YajC [unclassified Curtobacterium]PYY35038.1 preprotein translocase subunit YajC [Curtobacterium sp. MCBD17_029]PYY42426.1 preprotein translocase subunit YajC [Curtobacterium sp. MCPF17_046]PYY51010.1 preprotein translocase subunit YajC [Curtobacterium sp. MCBD17_023]PYY55682.1 preprotein translocase subunit YajC [Curtobacterium sp. MCJR17_055]PYY60427.1 preprotein translocase subunit YajC [Curtobacterium sp. MCPF17_015]
MDQYFLIIIIVAFAAFMFYSSRKRKKQQSETASQMVPGARVMLSFGLYGTLVSVDDEKVTADVEIAPGTVVTVHRQTLSRVVPEETPEAVETTTTTEPAADHVTELNGEPIYGERVEDVDTTKRKTED